MSQAGFSDTGFGYGGYRAPVPPPPPPPGVATSSGSLGQGIPLPPIYGPLRSLLNSAPPEHPYDQQPQRQTVRIGDSVTEPLVRGPGSESVVPYSLFSQMLLRMEQLEKENELLLKVVMELNDVIEKERGNALRVFEHPSVGTSTAPPASSTEPVAQEDAVVGAPPPWRIKK